MTAMIVVRKRSIGCTKVKTGCDTCRVRKVKCDEGKPFRQRCVKTGRTCDGYGSSFRYFVSKPAISTHTGHTAADVGPIFIESTTNEISSIQEAGLLNRCFSTKTILDVDLDCEQEARQILQASLTDPSIRHAISSLKTLREDLETFGDSLKFDECERSSNFYGLQQYGMALGGVASGLSSSTHNAVKSALLCCQIFISIEQVRKNYTAMAQHITCGLKIVHEYRVRPSYIASKGLLPACNPQLPLLDVFIVKLFAAPCKFADAAGTVNISEAPLSSCLISPRLPAGEIRGLRKLAPDMRANLTRIATSTITFLGKVSQIEAEETALQLLTIKAALLKSLELWGLSVGS